MIASHSSVGGKDDNHDLLTCNYIMRKQHMDDQGSVGLNKIVYFSWPNSSNII